MLKNQIGGAVKTEQETLAQDIEALAGRVRLSQAIAANGDKRESESARARLRDYLAIMSEKIARLEELFCEAIS